MNKNQKTMLKRFPLMRKAVAGGIAVLLICLAFAGVASAFTYSSNDYNVTPTGSVVPGTKMTASMTVSYPDGSVIPTQLNLDSALVGVSWTVVKNPGSANAMTSHPTYPYDYVSNFDIYESSGSVVLKITITGTVSSESAGKSISPLTLSESGGSGSIYTAPTQYVYDTGSLAGNLQTLSSGISSLEATIEEYVAAGYDCSQAKANLETARSKYQAAVTAGTENGVTAFSNYEAGVAALDKAKQSLAYVSLSMILTYTAQIDDIIPQLYENGWNIEANLVDTKNTKIKTSYDACLKDYQAGDADMTELASLRVEVIDLYNEATGYLTESEITASAKLSAGWNFISVPKKLSADYDTAAELFADVDLANHALLSYNAQTKSWDQLTGSSVISPLDAIWIYSASPVTLLYEFSTSPTTPSVKKVYEGWNAVGISADSAIPAQAAFGNTDWYTYLCWNSAKQKFYTPIIKGSSGNYADTNSVYPWSGGWLYVNADGNYVGFTA